MQVHSARRVLYRAATALALAVTLAPFQGLVGQSRKGSCVPPLPGSVGFHGLRLSGDPGVPRVDSPGNPVGVYVSAEGRLCRKVEFRMAEGSSKRAESSPQAASPRSMNPGKAFLLSAAVPGAGQWYLGQNRWPAYLAVELWAWIQFLDRRREGRELQRQYKDLAWFVARRVSTGPRTDAGWDYYEALTKFSSSGAYDANPAQPGVQPEEDPATFNGSIWALAREIFLPEDPETPLDEDSEPYRKAFDYYFSRAYTPDLAWNWGSNTLHLEEYTTLIRNADEALRGSTAMIGVMLANHLLSAVDALVTGRLGVSGNRDPALQLNIIPGPYSTRQLALLLRLPDPMTHGH